MANATAKTAADYVADLGRAQSTYKSSAGNAVAQKGASISADEIRAQAKAAGVDLSSYGTKNAYGTDYTQNAGGSGSGVNPTPGTPESHQAYIDKTMGGAYSSGKYAQDNIGRYNSGDISYNALLADSKRVGYAIPGQNGKDQPTPGVVDTGNPASSGPSGPSSSDRINDIYNNNYESQAAKIRATRDQLLAGLAGQDTMIKNQATANLNQNDVTGAQQANALREHMANLGIGQGGDYISQQVGQDTATQQNANDIRQNASQRLEQLLAMENQIKNSANDQDLSLLKDIQSQIAKAQLDQSNTDRQFGLQEGGLTGNYNNNRTLAGQQFDAGQQNDQRNFDYTKGIDQRNYDYQQTRDSIADANYKQTFDENVHQFGITTALDKAYKDKQISIDQYNAATARINATNRGSSSSSKTSNNPFIASIYSELDQLQPSDYEGYLTKNRATIIGKIGQKGYDDLKKSALSDQSSLSKSGADQSKTDLSIREKAIAAAQKDPDWFDATKRTQLIKDYEALFR